MVFFDDARCLEAAELKYMIDRTEDNPTVERLLFVEQRSSDGSPGRLFPCWLTAWGEEEDGTLPVRNDGRKWLVFQCSVVQSRDGKFSMLPVTIRETELISQKRIWDKPPSACCNMNMFLSDGLLQ